MQTASYRHISSRQHIITITTTIGIIIALSSFAMGSSSLTNDCTISPGVTVPHNSSVTLYRYDEVDASNIMLCNDNEVDQCLDGILYNNTNTGDYQYTSCGIKVYDSCDFDGITLLHNQSISAFYADTEDQFTNCVEQVRTCDDGVLSGSFMHTSCDRPIVACGNASNQPSLDIPQHFLCNGGVPSPVSYSGSIGWTRTCSNIIGLTEECHTRATNLNPHGICHTFNQPFENLEAIQSNLCDAGSVENFREENNTRLWSCVGANTSQHNCRARQRGSAPDATVTYSPSTPTTSSVTATLTNFVIPGTVVINNTGQQTYTFTENGTFDFEIRANGQNTIVTATVDRIVPSPQEQLDTIMDTYRQNSCPRRARQYTDISQSDFYIDIISVVKHCIMHGFLQDDPNRFRPEKELSNQHFVALAAKLYRVLTDYDDDIDDDDIDLTYSIDGDDTLREYIRYIDAHDLEAYMPYELVYDGYRVIDRNGPVKRAYVKDFLMYLFLDQGINEDYIDALFDDQKFLHRDTIRRGEVAHIITTILSNFDQYALGHNDFFLRLLDHYTQGLGFSSTRLIIEQMYLQVRRTNTQDFATIGLHKAQLLNDLQRILYGDKKPILTRDNDLLPSPKELEKTY